MESTTTTQYDGLIYHATEDGAEALSFQDMLIRVLHPDRLPSLITTGYDETVNNLQNLMGKSTYIFLWLTRNFVSNPDCVFKMQEIVMESVISENRWRVIPVYYDLEKDEVPMGLKSVNGLHLNRMFILPNIRDSMELMTRDNIYLVDRYFSSHLQRLFDDKQELKSDRQRFECIRAKLNKIRESERNRAQKHGDSGGNTVG